MRRTVSVICTLLLGSAALHSQVLCGEGFMEMMSALDSSHYELPLISDNDTIVIHTGYVCSFSPSKKIPIWVAYELTREEVQGETPRKGSFKKDPLCPYPQASNADYSHSGYDKGHMAPAADMKWNESAMLESFYFTNMCPQTPTLNRQNWLRLEEMGRKCAESYSNVKIVCGPVVSKSDSLRIGSGAVAVPHAFFKAFLAFDGKDYISIGFVMRNGKDKQSPKECCMSIDSLETICRLDLFHNLEDSIEKSCEATINPAAWGMK